MKAEEMRIGNYVNTIEGITQIEGICKDGRIATTIMDGGDLLEWCESILLTEEWLLKFGFKLEEIQKYADGRTPQMEYCKQCLMMIRYQNNSFYPAIFGYPLNGGRSIYVHQLQNLYFTLTGEELTITPAE